VHQPEQVDEIYITHRGQDHIGGLTIGHKRAFPNAILRAPRSEFDLFLNPKESARLLAESHNVNTALLISRAFGLRNLNDLESLGRASDQPLPWEQTRFRDLDGAVLTELDLGALIRSEAFATIGI